MQQTRSGHPRWRPSLLIFVLGIHGVRRRLAGLTALFAISLMAQAEGFDTPRCQGRTEIVGPCFSVHGRLAGANGNPSVRIWRIGTKRILGVDDDYELPPSLRNCGWGGPRSMYGDFHVCPLSREQPGVMQFVCVESATGLVLEEYPDYLDRKPVSTRRLTDEGCAGPNPR
jgi:hypothetical protein